MFKPHDHKLLSLECAYLGHLATARAQNLSEPQGLAWLRLELRTYRSPRALAVTLQVPSSSLRAWLSSPVPTITLSDLRAIAEYRRWSLQQTMGWLELKPAHGEAKAIWFGKPAR